MTFIIAEIGVNHDGDFEKAKHLIDMAYQCGADAVKFQLFDSEKLEPPGPRRDMLKGLELSRDAHEALQYYCSGHIEYICTPFDIESLNFLANELTVKTIKISSGDLSNTKLILAAHKTGCHIILSTGMAGIISIWTAYDYCHGGKVSILHCVSSYPTEIADANLNAVKALKQNFDCPIGLSDHSLSTVLPSAAVALGATVIEKHLTFSRFADGPDHKASLTPVEFRQMVENCREVESAMGSGEKAPQACESDVIKVVKERQEYRS